ncbi:MAG: hypothetical protein P8010_18155 [Desulfosarcinaceae bacterium]
MAETNRIGTAVLLIEAFLFNIMLWCFFINKQLGIIALIFYILNIMAGVGFIFFIERKKKSGIGDKGVAP